MKLQDSLELYNFRPTDDELYDWLFILYPPNTGGL